MITKTINIYLTAELERASSQAPFNYLHPVILDNKIVIVPEDDECNFLDAWLSDSFVEEDFINDNVRTLGINLSVNVELVGTANDDFYIDTDRLKMFGDLVIGLDANKNTEDSSYAKFIDPVVVNLSADLVEEIHEEPADEDALDIESIEADVLTEEEEVQPQWIIEYNLNEMLHEAQESEVESNKAVIEAPDIETAIKYAEQNARIKAKEDASWNGAEVISVKKKES